MVQKKHQDLGADGQEPEASPEKNVREDGGIFHKENATEETKADMNAVSGEASGKEWQVKAEEYLEDWKRTQAEFENYKKRQAAQQKELAGHLIEKLVLDIIPVLDNFRSATEHVPEKEKASPWVIGIQYIEKQLEAVLLDNGIEPIAVEVGDGFDPSIHEAIGQTAHIEHHGHTEQSREVAFEKEEQRNVVTQVLHKGYRFGTRVVRPARVIVN